MPEGFRPIPRGQQEHIKINAGNVLAVGILSVLWVGATGWVSSWLARTEIPVLSQLAVGAQYYLKAY